jgi:lipid II:glycine glycyltransferase (peptidoglycan interpeptide bridge formation enzyme)
MSTAIRLIEREEWQKLAPSFRDYNYRQLWDFGVACARRVGAVSEHVAVCAGEEVIALADVRLKQLPVLAAGIAYVNGGPLIRCGANGQFENKQLREVLATLTNHYVKTRKAVLRIQPALGPDDANGLLNTTFVEMGYSTRDQLKRYRTIVLDIAPPLEAIRKQLEQKWRNCLNNSEKRGLTVKTGTDEVFFSTFINLYKELIGRKDFGVDLAPEFYFQVQQELAPPERFLVSLVYENEQPIAGHVASILGDTCVYLLGAGNEAGLRNKAAYLAQWSVIQTAKERGCHLYDLGGIDPEANPGVYHFKKGLGGTDVTAPGPFECFPSRWAKAVVPLAEKAYRMYRKVR